MGNNGTIKYNIVEYDIVIENDSKNEPKCWKFCVFLSTIRLNFASH